MLLSPNMNASCDSRRSGVPRSPFCLALSVALLGALATPALAKHVRHAPRAQDEAKTHTAQEADLLRVNGKAEAFLMSRDAIRVGDSAKLARLAPQVRGYPLEPYLQFWQVRYRLEDRSPEELRAFLERNEGTVLAEQLRLDWLKLLGSRAQWQLFAEQRARLVNDDPDIACYALQSRGREAGDEALVEPLKVFWLAPRDLPEGCVAVAQQLRASGRLGSESIWQRFRVLSEAGRAMTARRLVEWLPPSEAPSMRRLEQAFDQPLKVLIQPGSLESRAARELLLVAYAQVARSDPSQAAGRFTEALRAGAMRESFSAEERAYVWGQIAAAAARKHMPEALDWFSQADETALSDDQLAWRVRSALRAGAWRDVSAAIERMSARARADSCWAYWQARSLKAQGRSEEARNQFAALAGETNYYGRLAAEEIGLPMQLPPKAPAVTQAELNEAAAVPGLQRALALFALGMRTEGIREWNWALRGMDDRRLLAAAELASANEIWDRAIATADRTFSLHDFSLRYPAPHREIFAEQARMRALDEPWVLGLVRQESRFIAAAKSSAGAAGLMQLMPATARWVARQLGMKSYSSAKIHSIDLNAAMGTYYLRHVLDSLDGQPVLASAAYNAGPNRARAWLDAKPLEGAIYIESIPFGETRDYVKKVMTNAVYYSAVLGGRPFSLKEKLGFVARRSMVAANVGP